MREGSPTIALTDFEKSASRSQKKRARLHGEALLNAESRRRAPEAQHLHSGEKSHEHIGHMLISAELKRKPTKKAEVKAVERGELPSASRVATMSRSELLTLSETIMIDGMSLHQVYETSLVGEQALRRLIAEHVRGGDMKKALRREILEHEIDFERDPAMRGIGPSVAGDSDMTGDPKSVLSQLVERASASMSSDNDTEPNYAQNHHTPSRAMQQTNRRLIDISFAVIITILAIMVLTMYLTRS